MNIANAESILHLNTISRFLDKFWIIKMYHNISLRKTLFFEIFSEIMVFVRMNLP